MGLIMNYQRENTVSLYLNLLANWINKKRLMEAITFDKANFTFGENQKEYEPIPAMVQNNGVCVFKFKLNDFDVDRILRLKRIKLTRLTFGRPLQPAKISIFEPFMGDGNVSHKNFSCDVKKWGLAKIGETSVEAATMEFNLSGQAELIKLKETKAIWLIISAGGQSLQPISFEF